MILPSNEVLSVNEFDVQSNFRALQMPKYNQNGDRQCCKLPYRRLFQIRCWSPQDCRLPGIAVRPEIAFHPENAICPWITGLLSAKNCQGEFLAQDHDGFSTLQGFQRIKLLS